MAVTPSVGTMSENIKSLLIKGCPAAITSVASATRRCVIYLSNALNHPIFVEQYPETSPGCAGGVMRQSQESF
jgi:hypothetical protein